MSQRPSAVAITGMGVLTAIGNSIPAFRDALFAGRHAFGILARSGRCDPGRFLGAEIPDESVLPPDSATATRLFKSASLKNRMAISAASQAWNDAKLADRHFNPERMGLVVATGGIGFREQTQTQERYAKRLNYLRPSYAVTVCDTDLLGTLSESFGIHGEGLCVGGASAAGAMALIQAVRQVQSGVVEACLAVAPLCDLSRYELQAFYNLGAMGSHRYQDVPELACRPFDEQSNGFIFGEGCAAIVVERVEPDSDPSDCHALILGQAVALTGQAGPASDSSAQQRAMLSALQHAGLSPQDVDYVNAHGTSSPHGDRIELESLAAAGLKHCLMNSTKSLTGHCLTSAGMVEAISTVIQLKAGQVHGNRNLVRPIDASFRWPAGNSEAAKIDVALSNSFAFGGVNCSIVFANPSPKNLS